MNTFPILKLPTELQLLVLDKLDCAHERYCLATVLDEHYEVNEYLNYVCKFGRDVIAPWLRTRYSRFATYGTMCFVSCACEDCQNEAKRDYERMNADEYDYQMDN